MRVKSSIAKNGKQAEQPVPAMLVNVLTALKAHARPNADDRVLCPLARRSTRQSLSGKI